MANTREDTEGKGHPYGFDGHKNVDEAKQKLLEAMSRVREIFPNLKLETMLMREMDGRATCDKLKSSCYNGVVRQLVEKILNEYDTFQADPLGDVQVGERNVCKDGESLTAVTVHLPIAERPLNRAAQKILNRKIPLEKTYEFFEFMNESFKQASLDPEIQKRHIGCDCEQYLLTTFSLVRAASIKRLYNAQGKGRHNTLLTALACFCIQHKFMLLAPLKGSRQTCFPQIKEEDWPDLCIHVTEPYLQDRIRHYALRKQPWQEAAVFENKYKKIEAEIRNKYPFLFKKDGTFEVRFLDIANPGGVFECVNCCEEYPKRFSILCQPLAGTNSDSEKHALCFNCLKKLADATNDATPFSEDGLGLICVIRGCSNTLQLRDVQRYLSRNVRRMLHERTNNIVLSMAKVANLERCKRCGMPAICDCPKDVNKVYACPKCGYSFCRICEVDWDDHFGKNCNEIPMNVRVNNLRRRIDERLIRRCPNCTIPFLKGEACNCVACPCGVSNCYLCRATGIGHAHFCGCKRTDADIELNEVCRDCGKKCRLFCDTKKVDGNIVAEVKKEAAPDVLRVLEEEEKGTVSSSWEGSHSDANVIRQLLQNHIKAPVVPQNNEPSPLPPVHWQMFHNPANRGNRMF